MNQQNTETQSASDDEISLTEMFGIFFAFALKVKKKYEEEKENRKTSEVKELTNA
jgi:hypothetical protein